MEAMQGNVRVQDIGSRATVARLNLQCYSDASIQLLATASSNNLKEEAGPCETRKSGAGLNSWASIT